MNRCLWLALFVLSALTDTRLLAQASTEQLPPGALLRFGDLRDRHDDAIYNSALAPDGKRLATVSNHAVAVWDAASGRKLAQFPLPLTRRFPTPGLAFSPNGRYLGLVYSPQLVLVWDLRTALAVLRFEAARATQRRIAHCQFSMDSKQFLFWSQGRLGFHDLNTGVQVRFVSAAGKVHLLSPDTRTYLGIPDPQTVVLGDAVTGKELLRLEVQLDPRALQQGHTLATFTPDSKTVVFLHQTKEIQLREVASGKLQRMLPVPPGVSHHLRFTEDGRTLFLTTEAGAIHRWEMATGKELPSLRGHAGPAVNLHALADGKTLISTGHDGLIRRWHAPTGKELAEPPGYQGAAIGALSHGGNWMALGDQRGRLDVYDSRTGKLVRVLREEGPPLVHLSFSPDGKTLASIEGQQVQLWELPSGKALRLIPGEKNSSFVKAQGPGFCPNGHLLAITLDRGLRLLEVPTGKIRWEKRPDQEGFRHIAFTPDSTTLAAVWRDSYVYFFDAVTGATARKLRLFPKYAREIDKLGPFALSPDGRWLTGFLYGRLGVYDVATGQERKTFQMPKPRSGAKVDVDILYGEGVKRLAYAPDGLWLAGELWDGSVQLWDAVTGQELLRLIGHRSGLTGFRFSPDSRTLCTFGNEGQAVLWSLRPPGLLAKPLPVLWVELLGADSAQAFHAAWSLSERKGTAEFLRLQLPAVSKLPPGQLAKLIADLKHPMFKVRESAVKGLAAVGDLARPALEAVWKKPPSAEVQLRVRKLLDALPAVDLRVRRAVKALELADTAEARATLRIWAAGAPGAQLTESAAAVLARWEKRQTTIP